MRISQTKPHAPNTAPLNGLLRAGLAHLWFETIHPFEDGNGSLGRALVDLALAQDLGSSSRALGKATRYAIALNSGHQPATDPASPKVESPTQP